MICTIIYSVPLTIHNDASDKQVGAVIIQNKKHIDFFAIILSKPQLTYATTEKKPITIVEWLKKFRGILFEYKINIFSYHKNLVYATTLSKSQMVMPWRLIT